jgi:hypothetical protein
MQYQGNNKDKDNDNDNDYIIITMRKEECRFDVVKKIVLP